MKAVRLTTHGGPEVLEHATVATPTAGAKEVLIEVGAVALNNTDVWTREGAYGLPGDPSARAGWRGPITFPRIQGADVAGRVVAAGEGTGRAAVGGRVLVDPAVYDSRTPTPPASRSGSARSTRMVPTSTPGSPTRH